MPAYRSLQPHGTVAPAATVVAPASPCAPPGAACQASPQATEVLTAEEQALLLDLGQFALDVVGFVDPTPTADGLNMAMSMARGDWTGAGISAVGMLPYLGDLAKAPRMSKHLATLRRALDLAAGRPVFRSAIRPLVQQLARGLDRVRDLFPDTARVAIDNLISRMEALYGARFVPVRHGAALFRAAHAAFTAGLKKLGGPRRVRIALYFGLSDAAVTAVRSGTTAAGAERFHTVLDILAATDTGARLLRQLNDAASVSWRMQEEVWLALSDRVSRLANGRNGTAPAQVFVNRQYFERVFPGGRVTAGMGADETLYALGGRNRFSGRYEDEIFHKVEAPNLNPDAGIRFTVLDDKGAAVDEWVSR